jgi:hypothetical protein
MKSFKFFKGYVDPTGEPISNHFDTEYRFLGDPNIFYGGVDLAEGIDRVGARRMVLAGLRSAEDVPDAYGRVGTRRINATWTREMADDVARFHNIDAEQELTALLTEQMSHEIDRNMLRSFRQIGASTAFSQPSELRRTYNEIEVSQSGVRFIRSDNTPIVQGII